MSLLKEVYLKKMVKGQKVRKGIDMFEIFKVSIVILS